MQQAQVCSQSVRGTVDRHSEREMLTDHIQEFSRRDSLVPDPDGFFGPDTVTGLRSTKNGNRPARGPETGVDGWP